MTATCQLHRAHPVHRIWILLSKSNRTRCSDVQEAWLQLLWGRILTVKGHLAVHPPAACSAATCYCYVTHKRICLRIIVKMAFPSAAKYTSSVFTVHPLSVMFTSVAVTHLHQQLSAQGVIVVVREDLGQLAEGSETFPVGGQRGQRTTITLQSLQAGTKPTVTLPPRSSLGGGLRCTAGRRGWLATRRSSLVFDTPENSNRSVRNKPKRPSVPGAHELSKPEVSPGQLLSTSPADGLSGWASVPGCSGRWWWHSWWQSWIGPRWLWWWEPGAPYLSYPAETKSPPGSGREPPSWTDPEWTQRKRGVKIDTYF